MESLYNSAAPLTAPGASRSQLRTIHNLAKKELLFRFGPVGGGARIIDMGCGRGGDIHKYSAMNPSHLLMVDASSVSISDARKRMEDSGYVTKKRSIGSCTFSVRDLSLPEAVEKDEESSFHLACCMFVVHYFFGSEERLDAIVGNASRALRDGGVWLLTFIRGSYLLEATGGTEKAKGCGWEATVNYGNGAGNLGAYGNGVTVSLDNTIVQGGSDEFLVSPSELNRVCAKHGLHPIEGVGRIRGELVDLEVTDLPNAWRLSPKSEYDGCDYTRMNVAMAFRKTRLPPSE